MAETERQGRAATSSRFIVWLVFLIFFVISFLTNILGPLVPDIISGFRVSLAMAAVRDGTWNSSVAVTPCTGICAPVSRRPSTRPACPLPLEDM